MSVAEWPNLFATTRIRQQSNISKRLRTDLITQPANIKFNWPMNDHESWISVEEQQLGMSLLILDSDSRENLISRDKPINRKSCGQQHNFKER